MERAQLELRHGRSESFGEMGKVYFGCNIGYVRGRGLRLESLVGAKLVVLVCP